MLLCHKCSGCGAVWLSGSELDRFELEVARRLAVSGDCSPPSIRFMRESLGMLRSTLASRLGVACRMIEQWECGQVAAPPHGAQVLHQMVLRGPEQVEPTILLRDQLGPYRGLACCRIPARVPSRSMPPRALPSWRRKAAWSGLRRNVGRVPSRGSA
jgi:DNA-binding transcriptional regulator YiaG